MFIDLLRERRSIRRFKDKPVEKELVNILVEAALRSPCGLPKYGRPSKSRGFLFS
jgi:nitroreductase